MKCRFRSSSPRARSLSKPSVAGAGFARTMFSPREPGTDGQAFRSQIAGLFASSCGAEDRSVEADGSRNVGVDQLDTVELIVRPARFARPGFACVSRSQDDSVVTDSLSDVGIHEVYGQQGIFGPANLAHPGGASVRRS